MYCLWKFILEYIPKYVIRQIGKQQIFVRTVNRPSKIPVSALARQVSVIPGPQPVKVFPVCTDLPFLTLATLKNDDLQYQTMTGSALSLSPCRGDYPMITFWGWLQPATIPSNPTGWLWTACDRMDCFLSPETRMGEKAACEWEGEVVDVGFRSTSTASTSLAVGELLQLMVQQPSALVVTGMLATIKTVKLWWRWQSQLIEWIKFISQATLL